MDSRIGKKGDKCVIPFLIFLSVILTSVLVFLVNKIIEIKNNDRIVYIQKTKKIMKNLKFKDWINGGIRDAWGNSITVLKKDDKPYYLSGGPDQKFFTEDDIKAFVTEDYQD